MKIEVLYRNFMVTPSNFIPVVDQTDSFIGFLSKSKLVSEMSNLDHLEEFTSEKIIDSLLEFKISDDLLSYFEIYPKIPVLNLQGEKVTFWTKIRTLTEYNKTEQKQDKQSETNEKDKINWFLKLILENFPDPLLITDLDGRTVLYNESFEVDILGLKQFDNSIERCEKELQNMKNKSLTDKDSSFIFYATSSFSYHIRFKLMVSNREKIGYIYHFVQKKIDKKEVISDKFYFDKSLAFSQNVDRFERFHIIENLKENSGNISRTAKSLKIARTTLQNKIKHFGINDAAKKTKKKKS